MYDEPEARGVPREAPYQSNDTDGTGNVYADGRSEVGHAVCSFKQANWIGDCRYNCSGTGPCYVLRRLGI